MPQKVAYRACHSVELNVHSNRQFLAHFVVHMPLCVHVLFRVARSFNSNRGEGTDTWGMLSQGCEDTVACRCLLFKGGGGHGEDAHALEFYILYP